MNATSLLWAIALFFGCSIAFAALRRLTQDQGAAVTALVQLGALAVIIVGVVVVVRRTGGDD
jgi:hypothetical protein